MKSSNRVRIVLVNPQHPGNIGAVARAMKTMGLYHLVLVAPREFPHKEATVRASGADDILAQAEIAPDLLSAIRDCELVFATSARDRHLAWPSCDPRACANMIIKRAAKQTAIVFGRENNGLTNEELALCHYHVTIPTDPNFSSLNLASAVQVLAYELKMVELAPQAVPNMQIAGPLATVLEVEGLINHLQQVMLQLGYLDALHPRLLMHRIRRLFTRMSLEKTEVNILRGFLSAVEKSKEM